MLRSTTLSSASSFAQCASNASRSRGGTAARAVESASRCCSKWIGRSAPSTSRRRTSMAPLLPITLRPMPDQLVLVTGGSGFIGAHCIKRLHEDGYRVRTTVRSLAREPEVRDMVGDGPLEVVAADLTDDAGWAEAVAGCDYVLHVASPFPLGQPKHEDELIVPARDGALRVLRAAREAGVRRVVLTSSFAAIGYGHRHADTVYDETSWTDVDGPGVSAYAKSKTV